MEFREFFEEQERTDESLMGLAKSGWGIAKGLGNTVAGAMTMGDEAIAASMGQGTKGRFGRGSSRFGRGIRQIFVGDQPRQDSDQAPETAPNPPAQTEAPKEEKISFRCPNGHKLNAPASELGKKGKCPKCGQPVRIPDPKERPRAQPQVRRDPPPGEPRPNQKYAELSKNYEKAKNDNNQAVMRYIQFLMSQADPVYYRHVLEKGISPKS